MRIADYVNHLILERTLHSLDLLGVRLFECRLLSHQLPLKGYSVDSVSVIAR